MSLKRAVRRKLLEALIKEGEFFKAFAVLKTNREHNLTDILDNLRAVCDITIVNLAQPSKPLSDHTEMSKIDIKFRKKLVSLKEQIKIISANARKIPGVHSFRIINVNKLDM